jgi:hypothetical protein
MGLTEKLVRKYVVAGKRIWIIKDWADNDVFGAKEFSSADDAEDFLAEKLGDAYETDRGEYYIQPKK